MANRTTAYNQGIWSQREHDLFLEALRAFPQGPWKRIADAVGTRSVRQVQTHAQKYNEKVMRRLRTGPKDRKTCVRVEHRIDEGVLSFCTKHVSDYVDGRRSAAAAAAAASSTNMAAAMVLMKRAESQSSSGNGRDMGEDDFSETDASSEATSESQELWSSDLEGLAWTDELDASDFDALSIDDSLDYLISALLAAE